MPWTSKAKDMDILNPPTPHGSNKSGIIGRAPGITSITFTPAELFGAAARCSYLHLVNPALVTPESTMIAKLVEQHVDDTSKYFAVMSSADSFKDYAKSYFSGTVAAGIAYLTMIADGYVWADHFENERRAGPGIGNSTATRSPDFVFARSGHSDVALLESKGTRSANASTFDTTVEDGYIGQVEPHLGYLIGGSTASHGYSIGAWMTSTTKADVNVHHTDLVTVAPSGGAGPGSTSTLQRNNYATAFSLAHSVTLAEQIRAGRVYDSSIPFIEFEWLNYRWLTGAADVTFRRVAPYDDNRFEVYLDPVYLFGRYNTFGQFAVEKTRAEEILRFVSRAEMPEFAFDIKPMPMEMRERARSGENPSAVFPDGLAVIHPNVGGLRSRVTWDGSAEEFSYL
jgi:hypothetical protein